MKRKITILKVEKNYYKILGVNQEASTSELRKAFCKLTKELHPDTTLLNLEDAKLNQRHNYQLNVLVEILV